MKRFLLILFITISTCMLSSVEAEAQLAREYLDLEQEVVLTTFPNPTLDYLYINLEYASEEAIDITIYDLLGSKRVTKHYEFGASDFQCEIDFTQMSQGTYLLQVVQGQNAYWKQIIKK